MFTALVVSRFVMNALYAVGFHDEKFYGRAKQRKVFNVVGKRKVFFIISIILILSCLLYTSQVVRIMNLPMKQKQMYSNLMILNYGI